MITDSALTVTQLNTYIKMLFDSDSRLKRICVVGEISNFVNHYKTGHCYFSIKDDKSSIKAVMFAKSAQYLKFIPENGMRVYVTGRVAVFERDGVYQIYAETMEPEGAGALMIAFEQLKSKLASEGLFDEERKKPIPYYPKKIGVITSPVGAALQDIINVLSRRYPLAKVVFYPVSVQGVNCAKENIEALNYFNKTGDVDVIILGRGGGSAEDLWGYNDEQLVRAVAASSVPVITGIGHETDFSLCDFASDLRAPTPSAAAELAVPDIQELYQILDGVIYRFDKAVSNYIRSKNDGLENLILRLSLFEPSLVIKNESAKIDALDFRINTSVSKALSAHQALLDILSEKLKLMNPLLILSKGYAHVTSKNKRICLAGQLNSGDSVNLIFADGEAVCEVTDLKITES